MFFRSQLNTCALMSIELAKQFIILVVTKYRCLTYLHVIYWRLLRHTTNSEMYKTIVYFIVSIRRSSKGTAHDNLGAVLLMVHNSMTIAEAGQQHYYYGTIKFNIIPPVESIGRHSLMHLTSSNSKTFLFTFHTI